MTVLRTSNAAVGLNKGKPIDTYNEATVWQRPSDWVTFTEPTASEQKVVGTVAVYNQDSNYLAVLITTNTGQYTVDWGDGTSTNHNSNTLAEKNYTWSSISSGTLTSGGYRQAVVTITPTTSGAAFTSLQLSRRNTVLATNTAATSPWLDIAVSAPNATDIYFLYANNGVVTDRLRCGMVEQVKIISSNITNPFGIFRDMGALQSVTFNSNSAITTTEAMFQDCRSLVIAPFINTPSVTRTESMFNGCRSLRVVPLYNTENVTNAVNMFNQCFALQSVPLFNFASLTTATSMFSSCNALESVPLFNFSALTSASNMFSNCVALKTVPLFNFSALTTANSMFNNCSTLETVPLFTFGSLTDMSTMFSACANLTSVPLFNTSTVTNMSGTFLSCSALETVPLFNTASVTNFSTMFASCTNLQTVPIFNMSSATNVPQMFLQCRSLREIPELNIGNVGGGATIGNLNIGNATINNANASLGRANIIGTRFSNSFQNCRMGATQLNEMYTGLATITYPVTNASGSGTVVTYTVGAGNALVYTSRTVTITGVTPVAYNLTNVIVQSVDNVAGTFTVSNAATGTYVSGGQAGIVSDRTITVTGNPGTATDNPAIATAKGWTVTG